ncbi:MAG: GNAT family N-acetyltransferase [Candidatus Methylacidiphilales bacterium]
MAVIPLTPRPVRDTTYCVRLATSESDVRRAQRLRFEVFNLELHEGLDTSFATGLDADPFDAACDHLLVEHLPSGLLVGTYRLQTGRQAAAHLGYYSEQEFDFSPFEPIRNEMIELGRACVHRDHRSMAVITRLWRGIADYARARGGRYLIGCSSLTSQDPADAAAVYQRLAPEHLVAPAWRTRPLPLYLCPRIEPGDPATPVPRLLAAYLGVGAKICGEPARDQQFKTIDFLTFLDLQALAPSAHRFL